MEIVDIHFLILEVWIYRRVFWPVIREMIFYPSLIRNVGLREYQFFSKFWGYCFFAMIDISRSLLLGNLIGHVCYKRYIVDFGLKPYRVTYNGFRQLRLLGTVQATNPTSRASCDHHVFERSPNNCTLSSYSFITDLSFLSSSSMRPWKLWNG